MAASLSFSTSSRLLFVVCRQTKMPCLLMKHPQLPMLMKQQVMFYPTSKHYNPKFRKERRRKFLKIDLPDFEKHQREKKMSPDELRMKMKKEGKVPPRSHEERPINISSTGGIFESFVPPEGDGVSTLISSEGAKQRFSGLEKKGKSFLDLRKIKKYLEEFDVKDFSQQAQDIVVEAQTLLQDIKKNEDRLHELVTERAYPELTHGLDLKTCRWKFVGSLEPPRVVHVRVTELLSKENLYAQITIRLHTQQCLAIYDRFGRLMYGSENLVKDVLEYVVFENHISNIYGQWRIHGKIIPDWMPPRDPILRTYQLPKFEPIEEDVENNEENNEGDPKENQQQHATV
ncbi:probable 39S ribosomal protein L45, mitochondrial isoform X2 [Octopus sinensis]|uniref:Large ribosomal subunit protein mL45 n=1 Tax=Octopus sinensis TaxID=2607531 RepID=A0A6P7S8K1_9MOLL|nr:probable 39S ribosomal protein L45, mitochondrial isoform X2 [Octopus sinensis]